MATGQRLRRRIRATYVTDDGGCTIILRLRHVVTTVQRQPGVVLRLGDFPEGAHYEIAALSAIFGVSRKRIWNVLGDYRAHFEPPRYRLKMLRRHRIIGPKDFAVLEQIFRSPSPRTPEDCQAFSRASSTAR